MKKLFPALFVFLLLASCTGGTHTKLQNTDGGSMDVVQTGSQPTGASGNR